MLIILHSLPQSSIYNPLKHLRWSFCDQLLTIIENSSILDIWQSSNYAYVPVGLQVWVPEGLILVVADNVFLP